MAKVEELISKYYFDINYNCAEAIFSAAMEAWEIDMPKETVKVMAGYGGGMGSGLICGAVNGGVAALSCKFVKGVGGHTSPELMDLVRTFTKKVRLAYGSVECKNLKAQFFDKEVRCYNTICNVARILDEVYEMKED